MFSVSLIIGNSGIVIWGPSRDTSKSIQVYGGRTRVLAGVGGTTSLLEWVIRLHDDVFTRIGRWSNDILNGEGKLSNDVFARARKWSNDILSGVGKWCDDVLARVGRWSNDILNGVRKQRNDVIVRGPSTDQGTSRQGMHIQVIFMWHAQCWCLQSAVDTR